MMGWTAQSHMGLQKGHCHGKELGKKSRWQEWVLLHGLNISALLCSVLPAVKLHGLGCPGRLVLQ